MDMLEPRIQQQFFESADLKYQSAELLSRPIADAVTALVGALTSGGRVLAAGPPELIAACEDSHTGRFLKLLLAQA